jgi:tetratricopeptide (TPR) repeat protein
MIVEKSDAAAQPTARVRHWLLKRRQGWGLLFLGLIAAGTAGWYGLVRPSEAQLLQTAIRCANRGEKEAAIPLFDEVLKRNPTESTALLYRGQLARDAGDPETAARLWSRVPDQPAREGATARYLEGTLFLEASRARQAEAAFLKAIALNPDYLPPHERLFKLYVAQLRAPDTRQQLEAIRRFRPWTLDELYLLVDLTGRLATSSQHSPHLERFIRADADDWHSLVALGRFRLRDDNYAAAPLLFRRALAQRPGDASVCGYLAEVLLARSDLAGARGVLAAAPADRNAPQCLWKSHGLYWIGAGESQRGAACLARAVALDASDLATTYKLAQTLERTGDIHAAAPYFRRVQLLSELESILFTISDRDRNHAPNDLFDVVVQAGALLLELEMNFEAAALFEQALAWRPESPAVRDSFARARERCQAAEKVVARVDAIGPELDVVPPLAAGEANAPPILPITTAPVRLVDRQQPAGLNYQYFNGATGREYLLEQHGGGVGVLDYDGDGWPDLYFPQSCKLPVDFDDWTYTDRLFRNLGNGTCADVTAGSGLGDNQFSQGCAAGDYNNDGFPDLAVANFGTNVLYRNNGDGTFLDVTALSGISGAHWSTSLAWGDLDRDGDLDLYVVNYILDPWRVCTNYKGLVEACKVRTHLAEGDVFYTNRGDGAFEDATRAADLSTPDGRGLGVIIADLDDDGWPDIFVANDRDPNFLFHNREAATGELKFSEMGLTSGTALKSDGNAMAGMGIACADLNGDGRLDLFVTNYYEEADTLYLNHGELLFEEAAARANLAGPTRLMTGWGAQAIDFDLDGRLDLFVANGHTGDSRDEGIPWKMPPQLFYNLGEGRFSEISRESGEFFHSQYLGRGVARLDWDRDGRPDLVVVHHDRPVALLCNETNPTGHRLILELHGVESNRDAIGARIRATCAGSTQILEICGGDGFVATNELRQIIGLGPATRVDELEIRWPSGRTDRWHGLDGDVRLLLIEGRPPMITKIDPD